MKKAAILLTVYNRKDITIKGLNQLYKSLDNCILDIKFDVFMTNDGCTDQTDIEVKKKFPNIIIINELGNLFWSKGMNKAWEYAKDYDDYDFYIWFNDDAILDIQAINLLFKPLEIYGNNIIVSGAFKDSKGNPSYGGRTQTNIIMEPNNSYQEIYFMNGNFVLIPNIVFNKLGFIDFHYYHSLGDWDYGLRANENNIKVLLTDQYVGETDRHDNDIEPFYDTNKSLKKRLKYLYSPKYSILSTSYFYKRHYGLIKMLKFFIASHIYMTFPILYKYRNK